jgi:polysaccharide export outer membrane protein
MKHPFFSQTRIMAYHRAPGLPRVRRERAGIAASSLRRRLSATLTTCVLAAACVLALVPPLAAQSAVPESPATLAPGDIVRIVVWRRPEFSGDYVVAPDSTITHPLLREVKVAGIPFTTVEERVRAFLTKFDANPAFVVSPLLRVFVGGEVRAPNVYNVPPGSTVAQLVALAGGPTERGDLEQVSLTRAQQRETFDLASARSAAATRAVRSGDAIVVARRRNIFTDVIVPAASLIAAAAAIANLFRH